MSDEQTNPSGSSLPYATQDLLRRLARDMRFMGYVYIIGGALYCLSIIGAIIGVPVLISGLRLKDAADSFGSYGIQPNASELRMALENQAKFFYIQKILIIVGIVLTVVVFITMFAFIGLLVEQGLSNMS